ncbi:MAG: HRDC domain-containing protein [Longimicrobiales bacterium]
MHYIHSETELAEAAVSLRTSDLIALDTEAAGYHRYHDRMCLLQLSTRSDTFLVDTLAVTDIRSLGPILAEEGREVVLHDAEYDLRLLARDHLVRIGNLFDTKIAAQLLGEPAIGLGALVEKYLDHKMDKKHQRADWAQRPLPQDMLEYAAEDTRHLPGLRDRLREELELRGRWHWAEEEFRLREDADWSPGPIDTESFLKIKNTRDLQPVQLAALRELHAWREGVASKRDVAPFRVVSNEVLVALARALPTTELAVSKTTGVPPSIADRYGKDMHQALARAAAMRPDQLPQRPRSRGRAAPDPELDKLVERLKTARDKAAEELVLDRGFLMPRQQLEDVAKSGAKRPADLNAVPDMRQWQIEALGEMLVGVLKG